MMLFIMNDSLLNNKGKGYRSRM